MKTNSKSYTHVFEAKLFNCANSYVAGSRYVTGNRYRIWQKGNNYVSSNSTVTQIISMNISTFRESATQLSNNINNYTVYKTKKHDQAFLVHSSSRVSDRNCSGQTIQLRTMVFHACHTKTRDVLSDRRQTLTANN